eukprot:UN25580
MLENENSRKQHEIQALKILVMNEKEKGEMVELLKMKLHHSENEVERLLNLVNTEQVIPTSNNRNENLETLKREYEQVLESKINEHENKFQNCRHEFEESLKNNRAEFEESLQHNRKEYEECLKTKNFDCEHKLEQKQLEYARKLEEKSQHHERKLEQKQQLIDNLELQMNKFKMEIETLNTKTGMFEQSKLLALKSNNSENENLKRQIIELESKNKNLKNTMRTKDENVGILEETLKLKKEELNKLKSKSNIENTNKMVKFTTYESENQHLKTRLNTEMKQVRDEMTKNFKDYEKQITDKVSKYMKRFEKRFSLILV